MMSSSIISVVIWLAVELPGFGGLVTSPSSPPPPVMGRVGSSMGVTPTELLKPSPSSRDEFSVALEQSGMYCIGETSKFVIEADNKY